MIPEYTFDLISVCILYTTKLAYSETSRNCIHRESIDKPSITKDDFREAHDDHHIIDWKLFFETVTL